MTWGLAIRLAAVLVIAGCSVDSPVSRTLGARCDGADECEDRCLSAPANSFPGGFCSTSCEASGDCQDDASCVDLVGGVCLFECADEAACAFLGAGWHCAGVPSREEPAQRVSVCIGT
jgi:hypothetical protein